MKIIIHVLLVALALLLSAYIIPGVEVDGLYIAIISALVLGLLNLIVKPILFILTLPITIITFGLFTFVLNALMVLFAASFLEGFSVEGFLPALLVSLFVSISGIIGGRLQDNS